ncbi:MAG: hypothetical protein DMD81_17315 [Candidatus Rokuibacteriota bacterium]|nr:MAG: hypothetical protein DMD81_17315 [Candidatus Rokubacteria bacterium]
MTEDDLGTLRATQVGKAGRNQLVEEACCDLIEPEVTGRAEHPLVESLQHITSLGRRQGPPLDQHFGQSEKILGLAC